VTRRVIAAAVLGAAAGYVARSELQRRLPPRHGWTQRAAADVSRALDPGWRIEAVNFITAGPDGGVEAWSVKRGRAAELMFSAPPVPDDLSSLGGEGAA
jgi:hypothetical protein